MTQPVYKEIPTEDYFALVKDCLAASGHASVRVTGVSMKPFLTPLRDTVTIVPLTRTLKKGDVALFNTLHGRYILHRVTVVRERSFDMRGDNTIQGEHGLPIGLIVGIVDSANRNGKIITLGSAKWRFYSLLGRINHTYRGIWSGKIRPILAKIYHVFIPRKNNIEVK